jgi:hypothetical protein
MNIQLKWNVIDWSNINPYLITCSLVVGSFINPVLALPLFIPLGHLVDTSKNISEQGPSTSLPDALGKERKRRSDVACPKRNKAFTTDDLINLTCTSTHLYELGSPEQ